MNKQKLEMPLDENGKPYWIPIVFKNRDALIGYASATHDMISIFNLNYDGSVSDVMGSDKFTDVTKTGQRLSEMSEAEVKKHIENQITNELDRLNYMDETGQSGLFNEYFLTCDCTCGNFIAFKEPADIPHDNMACDLCGKLIILYTGVDDDSIEYDGDVRDYVKLTQEVINESDVLNLDDERSDE